VFKRIRREDWRLTWPGFLLVALLGWLAVAVVVGVIVGQGIALGTADAE